MITLGVDAHKRTHTVVAVDVLGRQVATRTVEATSDGHLGLLGWVARFGQRCWAVEDCRTVTRRLENDLLVAGETVIRVPPKLMALSRRGARSVGKSDPIDALAIGRAALTYPGLPVARFDDHTRMIRLLSDRRSNLVGERTRLVNSFRWRLHELDPTIKAAPGAFKRHKTINTMTDLCTQFSTSPQLIVAMVARLGLTELARISDLTHQIRGLETELAVLVEATNPGLLGVVGVGTVIAGSIIGHVGDIDRFATENKFASWAATAPIPASSGDNLHHRINPGGDRQINAAIHRIAITQLAHHRPARQLVAAAMTRGKTKRDAIRILKRHITRALYTQLNQDQHTTLKTAA
jgi:transposase